jgi:hypothetical protein
MPIAADVRYFRHAAISMPPPWLAPLPPLFAIDAIRAAPRRCRDAMFSPCRHYYYAAMMLAIFATPPRRCLMRCRCHAVIDCR